MSSLTEQTHTGEFLVSEDNGHRSRDQVTIEAGQDLKAGHVLGKVSASGEYKEYNPGNADGSETAVAVAYDAVDAAAGAKPVTVINDDAAVNGALLTYFNGATDAEKETAKNELEAQSGIKVR